MTMNLADNPTTTSVVLQSSMTVTFTAFFRDTIQTMIPFVCVVAVAIAVDLYLGICVSRRRGEQIRLSRAIRRTLTKMVEYTGIVTLGATAAVAFDYDLIKYAVNGLALAAEMWSILSHFAELRGYCVNGKGLMKALIVATGQKIGIDLSGITIEKQDENK